MSETAAADEASTVEAIVEDDRWTASLADDPAALAAACAHALCVELGRGSVEAAILFADDARVRDLNARFRGKDEPTNVLAFPTGERTGHAGDVVLGFETVRSEAAAADLSLRDRTAHMIVHGLAHLLGFDHHTDDDAAAMETIEARALSRLGVNDPYLDDNGH